MPRPRGGAVLSPPTIDPLAADELDLTAELSYPAILKAAGAYRVPGQGIFHKVPIGRPFRSGGRWMQQQKAYPVAMSAEEAREKTRATGDRWDYYEPGVKCKKCAEFGDGIVSGWVLGGRKFTGEHAHVTNFDPTIYSAEEVDPPDLADEDAAADEAPVAVEA